MPTTMHAPLHTAVDLVEEPCHPLQTTDIRNHTQSAEESFRLHLESYTLVDTHVPNT